MVESKQKSLVEKLLRSKTVVITFVIWATIGLILLIIDVNNVISQITSIFAVFIWGVIGSLILSLVNKKSKDSKQNPSQNAPLPS
jgi:predicted tellurium resistance membrane protein TerC